VRDELWNRDVAEVFLQAGFPRSVEIQEFEVSPNGQWIDLTIASAESPLAFFLAGLHDSAVSLGPKIASNSCPRRTGQGGACSGAGSDHRLVLSQSFEATVDEMIERITSHSGPFLTMAKRRHSGRYGTFAPRRPEAVHGYFLNELYRLEDSQEGLRALIGKRKPNWKSLIFSQENFRHFH